MKNIILGIILLFLSMVPAFAFAQAPAGPNKLTDECRELRGMAIGVGMMLSVPPDKIIITADAYHKACLTSGLEGVKNMLQLLTDDHQKDIRFAVQCAFVLGKESSTASTRMTQEDANKLMQCVKSRWEAALNNESVKEKK